MCACVSVFVSVCVCVCSRCFRSVSSHWIYTLSTSSASQLTMRGLRSTPRSSPNDGGGAQEKPTLADLPPTRLQIHQPPLQPPQPPAPTAHAGGNFLPLGVLFTPPPLHRARTLAHLRLVSAHRAVRTLFRLTRGRGAAGGGGVSRGGDRGRGEYATQEVVRWADEDAGRESCRGYRFYTRTRRPFSSRRADAGAVFAAAVFAAAVFAAAVISPVYPFCVCVFCSSCIFPFSHAAPNISHSTCV